MTGIRSKLVLGLAIALLQGAALAAQGDGRGDRTAESEVVLLTRVDSLYDAGQPDSALFLLRDELSSRDSTGYALLWRAARAAASHGTALPGPYPQNYFFEEAMRWGELAEFAAVEGPLGPLGETLSGGSPADVTGGYWKLAATGLRAKNAAPGYGAELADQIWTGGYFLLERAPDDPRVHSLIGRLHFEIMSLSGMERLLGRVIVGGDVLGLASWEDAEMHLNRAVELSPGDLRYLMDLAALHAERRRPMAARLLAERVLESKLDTPDARAMKGAALQLLSELGG